MHVGLHFPQAEIGSDHNIIRDFVQTAEELGFSHLNVPDHVVQTRTPRGPIPLANNYISAFPHHETMTTLAFIAGVTKTIQLKSAVIIMPQRQAVLVAKQSAQIDVLSGGRMQLGIGLGWNEPEFEALDMNFRDRGNRIEEQIEVCRLLWTQEHVTFEGRWHTINDAGVVPMPIQRPIPIWIGAISDAAIKRAGRLADGWLVIGMDQPGDKTRHKFRNFKKAINDAGRNSEAIKIEATVWDNGNSPENLINACKTWKDMGVTQIVFRPGGNFAEMQKSIAVFGPLIKQI